MLLLRNAPHLVGKAPIEETRTEKRMGLGRELGKFLRDLFVYAAKVFKIYN